MEDTARTKLPPLTLALIAICIVVGLASGFGRSITSISALFITFYDSEHLIEVGQGQYWRLFTPVFIHFGLVHLVFNMLWFWELGGVIERLRGFATLGALVVVSAVVSNYLQFAVSGPLFGGMSGVVYALFGYIWMQGRFNPRFGVALHRPIVIMLLAWFLLCLSGVLEKLLGIHVANAAHGAGLATGVAWGFIAAWLERRRGI